MKRILIILSAIAIILSGIIPVSAANQAADGSVPYKQRKDFVWGMNIHPKGYEAYRQDAEIYIKQCAQLGVDTIRMNVAFSSTADFEYFDYVVKLCDAYGLKKMFVLSLSSAVNQEELDAITSYYEMVAGWYDGKSGHGFVDYFQIGNEEDIPILGNKYPINAPDGSQMSHYYETDLENLFQKWSAAVKGIKNSGSPTKSVINFSYYHYAPLQYAYEHGLDFDIVGIDWYTHNGSMHQILEPTKNIFPHDIFICETNRWSWETSNDEDVSEWDPLAGNDDGMENYMNVCYTDSRVKGLIYYELMDNPAYEREKEWTQEAHFGFLYSDPDYSGKITGRKPIYYKVQGLLGGKDNVVKKEVVYEQPDNLIDNPIYTPEPTPQVPVEAPVKPAPVPSEPEDTSSDEPSVEDVGISDTQSTEVKKIVTTTNVQVFPWLIFAIGSAVILLAGAAAFVIFFIRPAFLFKKK